MTPPALTHAEKMKRVRAKKAAAGLVKTEVWIRPRHRKALRDFVDALK